MEENQALPDRRPPTPYHVWNGGEWLLPEPVRETARYWAAAEKWEEIKQKRHDNLRGGVYVESSASGFIPPTKRGSSTPSCARCRNCRPI